MNKTSGPKTKKIKAGFRFRVPRKDEKQGLYFDNIMWDSMDRYKISDINAIEIRDWLSRYINKYIYKSDTNLTVESKAHARAIIRNQDKIESERK